MDLGANVTVLEQGDKTYYIVGTAHVSKKSVEEVAHVIETVRPDTVCVELCETRYKSLMSKDQWKNLDIFKVLKQGKALLLMANLALSVFQRKMGEQIGVEPGSELMEGVRKAEDVGAQLVLADRDIQITLKRTWGNLSFWKKLQVVATLFDGMFSSEEMSEDELEGLKEKDQLSAMMDEFAKKLPEVKGPLIDERDQFLMSKIQEAPGKKVVAVVGAGHVDGMCRWFKKEVDRHAISQLPKPSPWVGALKWVIPVLVIALFGWGIYGNRQETVSYLLAWVLPNAVFAGILTIVAGGKPLTVLTATLASPITSLNPLIGAGMVAGFVEAWLRRPTVEDCERITEDFRTIRGVYRNRFLRCLLVFLLASVGSALGSVIGLGWLVTLFTGS